MDNRKSRCVHVCSSFWQAGKNIDLGFRFGAENRVHIRSRSVQGASGERPGAAWNDPAASGSQWGRIVAGSGHRIGPELWQERGLGLDPGPFGAATGLSRGATDDQGAPIVDPKLTENKHGKGSAASPVSDPISDER